jgi:hypothetical protein
MGGNVMTPAERTQLIRTILDEQRQAMAAFHEASDAFDAAISGTRQTLAALHKANHAQGEAINRVIAANDAALALFDDHSTH